MQIVTVDRDLFVSEAFMSSNRPKLCHLWIALAARGCISRYGQCLGFLHDGHECRGLSSGLLLLPDSGARRRRCSSHHIDGILPATAGPLVGPPSGRFRLRMSHAGTDRSRTQAGAAAECGEV